MPPAAPSNPLLPFLPADNQGLGSAETEYFLESLNDSLGHLLSQTPHNFWQTAADHKSLPMCLDSYVQFVR